MSSSNLFAGLAGEKKSESPSAAAAAASTTATKPDVTRMFKGITSMFNGVGGKSATGNESPQTTSGSSTPNGTASSASYPGVPDRAQAQLVAAALNSKKSAAAAADGRRGSTTAPAATTSNKFLDFFKSDGEKRAIAAAVEREAKVATKRASVSSPRNVPEPIKLELHSSNEDADDVAYVGDVLHASATQMLRTSAYASTTTAFELGAESHGKCRFFRASRDGFEQICETVEPSYTTTIDDAGCRVCCQWVLDPTHVADASSTADSTPPQQSSFAEIGPVRIDSALASASFDCFQNGKACFQVCEQDTDVMCTITIKRTMIRITPAGGGELKASFLLRNGSAPSTVRFLLDPAHPLRFSIEDSSATSSTAAPSTSSTPSTAASSPKLFRGYIPRRRQRDIIAYLVRRIIATGSEALPTETEEVANADEPSSTSDQLVAVDIVPMQDAPDDFSVAITPAPSPLRNANSTSTSQLIENLSTLTIPNLSLASVASPMSTPQLSATSSPATSSTATAGAASPSPSQVAELKKRISELQSEKALFKENMNLILLDKTRIETQARAQVEALSSTIETQNQERAALMEQLDERSIDVDALKLALQNLSEQMTHLANSEVKLSKEIRDLKNERDQVLVELKNERSDMRDMQEKHEASIKQQARELMQELQTDQTEQLSTLTRELQHAKSECERLAGADERCKRLTEIESALRYDCNVYKQELAKYKEAKQGEADNTSAATTDKPRKLSAQKNGNGHGNAHANGHANGHAIAHVDENDNSHESTSATSDEILNVPRTKSISTSGTSTPTRTSAPSTSNAVDDAAFKLLTQQHSTLQEQFTSQSADMTALLESYQQAQEELTTVRASLTQSTESLAQLQTKFNELEEAHEEIVANRNYWKRKHESLSASMDRILKEQQFATTAISMTPSSSSSDLKSLSQSSAASNEPLREKTDQEQLIERQSNQISGMQATIVSLCIEKDELEQTLVAYKKSLDNTYQLLKYEREANIVAKASIGSSVASSIPGVGLFTRSTAKQTLQQQFDSVRSLANTLSETIADKDLSLEHMKKTNLILAKRVFDLERRFQAELENDIHGPTTNDKRFNGKIDLEEEERKFQEAEKSKGNSAATSGVPSSSNSPIPSAASSPSLFSFIGSKSRTSSSATATAPPQQ